MNQNPIQIDWRLSSQAPKNFFILLFVPRKKFSEWDEYIKNNAGEGLLTMILVYIVECMATKNYNSQPQNMVVDLNSKKKNYHYCSANGFSSSSLITFT